eukprot:1398678-Amphidinium_carterae.1
MHAGGVDSSLGFAAEFLTVTKAAYPTQQLRHEFHCNSFFLSYLTLLSEKDAWNNQQRSMNNNGNNATGILHNTSVLRGE